jgi:hypothetical protein
MDNATRNIFDRMEDGRHAAIEAENAIGEILGVELLGLGFDTYDASFEIFPDRDTADVAPTEEQHAAILALGCNRYWINFPDGTERYGRGPRNKATSNRWEAHNAYKDRPRSEEVDAERYRWLRAQANAAVTVTKALPFPTNHIQGQPMAVTRYIVGRGGSLDASIDAEMTAA